VPHAPQFFYLTNNSLALHFYTFNLKNEQQSNQTFLYSISVSNEVTYRNRIRNQLHGSSPRKFTSCNASAQNNDMDVKATADPL